MSPAHRAAFNGHLQALEALDEGGISLASTGYGGTTPLYLAAQMGRESVVKYLISKGVDLNHACTSGSGMTALIISALQGHLNVS